MAESDWIFKVLSGTNVGAEAPLFAEDLVVGRDEDCDIVLDDVTLSDRQFALRLEGDGALLTVLAEDPPLSLDGIPVTGTQAPLAAFQVVSVGTVHIAVGPASGDWSRIELFARGPEPLAPEEEEDEPESEDAAAQPVEDEEESATDEAPEPESRRRPRAVAGLAAILGILAVAGALGVWLAAREEAPSPDAADAAHRQAIESIVARYGPGIEVREPEAPGQSYEVVGYVDTESTFRRLVADLSALSAETTVSLTFGTAMLASARFIVDEVLDHRSKVDVSVSPDHPGVLHFTGFVSREALVDELKRVVMSDLTGLLDATFKLETLADRVQKLNRLLVEAGLTDRVDIEITVDGIDFYSHSPHPELDSSLIEIKERFNARYQGFPDIVWNPEGDFSGRTSLEIDISSVGLGERPHIVTDGGIRYQIGQKLDNGYIVKAITTEFILMRRGDESAYYFFDNVMSR